MTCEKRVGATASMSYNYRTVPSVLPPPRPDHSYIRPPKGKLNLYLWRWRIWFEATFGLTVYETWEKWVVLSIFAFFAILFMIAIFNYLPRRLFVMRKRTAYYLWGSRSNASHGIDEVEKALLRYLGYGNSSAGQQFGVEFMGSANITKVL
ncbi:hypothetical protein CPB83DRAFT_856612 [Crepidotus variabilis]|uniref:Uncharacterized protein n=1 Tax=Crepidotus variabilis TaxID=179855 RepID=A0A9P6EDS1_9AGAR|nr:hypothetical protein CPB83DRAFT_856612 [Crepidotus variabilis]